MEKNLNSSVLVLSHSVISPRPQLAQKESWHKLEKVLPLNFWRRLFAQADRTLLGPMAWQDGLGLQRYLRVWLLSGPLKMPYMVSASYLQHPQARRTVIGPLSHHVTWYCCTGLSLAQTPFLGPFNEVLLVGLPGFLRKGPWSSAQFTGWTYCGFHDGYSFGIVNLCQQLGGANMVPSNVANDKAETVLVLLAGRAWKLTLDQFSRNCLSRPLSFLFTNTMLWHYPSLMANETKAQKGSIHLKSHNHQRDSTVRPRCLVFSFPSVFVSHHSAFISRTAPLGKAVRNGD